MVFKDFGCARLFEDQGYIIFPSCINNDSYILLERDKVKLKQRNGDTGLLFTLSQGLNLENCIKELINNDYYHDVESKGRQFLLLTTILQKYDLLLSAAKSLNLISQDSKDLNNVS